MSRNLAITGILITCWTSVGCFRTAKPPAAVVRTPAQPLTAAESASATEWEAERFRQSTAASKPSDLVREGDFVFVNRGIEVKSIEDDGRVTRVSRLSASGSFCVMKVRRDGQRTMVRISEGWIDGAYIAALEPQETPSQAATFGIVGVQGSSANSSERTLHDLDQSKPVHVGGYYRKDGTYVRPHTRLGPGTRKYQ